MPYGIHEKKVEAIEKFRQLGGENFQLDTETGPHYANVFEGEDSGVKTMLFTAVILLMWYSARELS